MREESKSYAREAMDIVEHAAHKIGSRLPGSDGEIKFHQYMGDKLRDIGKAIGFDVDFDNASSTVLVKTTSDYSGDDEDANSGNSGNTGSNTTPTVTNPTGYTFNGSGWGHSVGMSQWGAYAMAQKGFTYDQILKFYFTGIEIAE